MIVSDSFGFYSRLLQVPRGQWHRVYVNKCIPELDARNLQNILPPDLHMSTPASRCFSSLLASITLEDPLAPVAAPTALAAAPAATPAPTLQTDACDYKQISTA
eukprot:5746946-Pyramimonas_sp.AAC.1